MGLPNFLLGRRSTGRTTPLTISEIRAIIGNRTAVGASQSADVSVVNSTVETNLATLALPTDLVAGDVVRFAAYGDLLNNSAGAVTYTWKFIVGVTTVMVTNAASLAQAASRRRWSLVGDLIVINPASSQRAGAILVVAQNSTSFSLTLSASATTSGAGYGTAAENLTAGKNAIVSVTLGTADALADCICHFAALEVFRA